MAASNDARSTLPISFTSRLAIEVDSIGYSYEKNISSKSTSSVLNNVSVHVPEGVVYALLGSNGCGKTTLLNILLGRIRPRSGQVKLFGSPTNSPGSKRTVHHLVGYMPQDVALYPMLTIGETFAYFAQVNHINDRDLVREHITSYRETLGLKQSQVISQAVEKLSGGQKRYLSLCVTLICQPKILLLDEPTVGIDSVIRHKIWDHIELLCQEKDTTVVITTHYIDEARQANLIGFLRQGRMLAEAPPKQLLYRFECKTLEDVFYKLCMLPGNSEIKDDLFTFPPSYSKLQHELENGPNSWGEVSETCLIDTKRCARGWLDLDHLRALWAREVVLLRTGWMMLFLFYIIPIISLWLYSETYGQTPKNMAVAIYNADQGINVNNFKSLVGRMPNGTALSRIYLELFDNDLVRLQYFKTEEAAFASVKAGHNVMGLAMRESFSEAFVERYLRLDRIHKPDYQDVVNLNLAGSIHVYIDNSRLLSVTFLNYSMLTTFKRLFHRFGSMAGLNPAIFSIPMQAAKPIYGSIEPNFQLLFALGVLHFVLVSINVLHSALKISIVFENGRIERDLNQGVRAGEILLTCHAVQLVATFIQVVVIFGLYFLLFGIQSEVDWLSAFALLYITAIQGIFIGSLISVFFSSKISVFVISFIVLTYAFLTSGTLWPIEGMHMTLQRIFIINPITLSIQALRLLMLRGWAVTHIKVWIAFISTGGTSLGAALLAHVFFYWRTETKLKTFDFL